MVSGHISKPQNEMSPYVIFNFMPLLTDTTQTTQKILSFMFWREKGLLFKSSSIKKTVNITYWDLNTPEFSTHFTVHL